MYFRRRRPTAPGSAIEESRQMAGLGDLPEDLYRERATRPPILTPRGNPTDDPFNQMPAIPVPDSVRLYNPQAHTTTTFTVPANQAIQIYATTRERPYSFIVNAGANPASLAYGRAPVGLTDGIPLAAAGVGFHELIYGTISTAWIFSTAGTVIVVVEGRYDPPMGV